MFAKGGTHYGNEREFATGDDLVDYILKVKGWPPAELDLLKIGF